MDPPRGEPDAILIDKICQRYGGLPHERILQEPWKLSIDAKVLLIAMRRENEENAAELERIIAESKLKGK